MEILHLRFRMTHWVVCHSLNRTVYTNILNATFGKVFQELRVKKYTVQVLQPKQCDSTSSHLVKTFSAMLRLRLQAFARFEVFPFPFKARYATTLKGSPIFCASPSRRRGRLPLRQFWQSISGAEGKKIHRTICTVYLFTPATSYFPRQLPAKYHRHYRA